jgi:hypothetical protein
MNGVRAAVFQRGRLSLAAYAMGSYQRSAGGATELAVSPNAFIPLSTAACSSGVSAGGTGTGGGLGRTVSAVTGACGSGERIGPASGFVNTVSGRDCSDGLALAPRPAGPARAVESLSVWLGGPSSARVRPLLGRGSGAAASANPDVRIETGSPLAADVDPGFISLRIMGAKTAITTAVIAMRPLAKRIILRPR